MGYLNFILVASLFTGAANAADDEFFYQNMEHDYDVPYAGRAGAPSRLDMIKEMGEKYPNIDCSADCNSADPAVRSTCKMGSLGALHVLTERQMSTNRTDKFIWQAPNASLNIEPYAYMKEMEAGIPCEESGFIKKFPTRKSTDPDKPAPIERVEVCKAWQMYFKSAAAPPAPTLLNKNGAAVKSGEQTKHTQSLLWHAHTASLLHSYWNYYAEYSGKAKAEVPREEYEMWMGWNRVVGALVPMMNQYSCGGDSAFIMTQLMPNCLRGTTLPNGKKCKGTNPPHLWDMMNRWGLSVVQNTLATTDFDDALNSMAKTVEHERSSPWASVIVRCPPKYYY